VGPLPNIFVAGDRDLYVKLLEPFPPTVAELTFADSFAEAVTAAGSAAIVVVDSRLRGGGVDLCRHLRSDPVTQRIPLILRVDRMQDHLQAITDARLLRNDLDQLVKILRKLCPGLLPGALVESGDGAPIAFNPNEAADHYRRPKVSPGEAEEWPPVPPSLSAERDMVELTKEYSGYMGSLLEALESPGSLSYPELDRLEEMVQRTAQEVEKLLGLLQSAINEALMAKKIERMKLLSTAKNSLYEQLQRLRALSTALPEKGPGSASHPDAPPSPPKEPLLKTPSQSEAKKGPDTDGALRKKSELTRAAEAKRAANLVAQRADLVQQHGPKRSEGPSPARIKAPPSPAYAARQGSARKESTRASWPIVVVILGCVIAVAIYFALKRKSPTVESASRRGNTAPVMRRVQIDRTQAGLVVRPQAEDKEGDRISFTIHWLVNGRKVEGQTTARLSADDYKPGDTVQAVVSPSDGFGVGSPMSSNELMVQRSPAPPNTTPPKATPPSATPPSATPPSATPPSATPPSATPPKK
jgi:hypothetical protein